MQPDIDDLESFLAQRGRSLLRTAVLLTGSKEAGEDLLQAALERLLGHRRTIVGDPEGYLRRTMYNLSVDRVRHLATARRRLRLLLGAVEPTTPDAVSQIDLRDALVRLLTRLPPQQRAVIVARYWEQLSEAETAALLGCGLGTVKSSASRGLHRLRELSRAAGDDNQLAQGSTR